jgi:WD40 repeat protein
VIKILQVDTGLVIDCLAVGFSPDGHTLATASRDGIAKLWDLRDPHHPGLLATLTGHTSFVWSVSFSPDGHTLATASRDGTARLWETNPDNAAARICATAWPTITKRVEPLLTRPHLPAPMPLRHQHTRDVRKSKR